MRGRKKKHASLIKCCISSHNNVYINEWSFVACPGALSQMHKKEEKGVRVMMFNATFNNISVISWWSVLLVEETRVPGEIQRPSASH